MLDLIGVTSKKKLCFPYLMHINDFFFFEIMTFTINLVLPTSNIMTEIERFKSVVQIWCVNSCPTNELMTHHLKFGAT